MASPVRDHAPDTDPFASLLTLEDQYFTEGYELGVSDGTRAGRIEGRLFGLEKGYSKALEMGRLQGRAVLWKAQPGKGSERLRKHIDRLVELTDPDSLETKNDEDAVNEFDERLAGAKAKATLISRVVGEDNATSSNGSDAAAAPRVSVADSGREVEVTRTSRPQSRRNVEGNKTKTGEMEDFAGLPQLARKAS